MPAKTLLLLFLLCLAAGVLAGLLFWAPELFFLDLRFYQANYSFDAYEFSPHLVLVMIDPASEEALGIALEGKGWRRFDARLIEILLEAGAAVIAGDIQYSHETTPWDADLVASFRKAERMIIAEEEVGITSPGFRESVSALASPAITTLYGVPRKIYRNPPGRDGEAETLAFAAADAYAQFLARVGEGDKSRELATALEGLSSFWIDYSYPVHYLPCYSYVDVLAAGDTGQIGPEAVPLAIFKNKVVLLAKDFPKDRFPIPNAAADKYPGGLVHAYGIETLLQGSRIRQVFPLWNVLTVIVCLLVIQGLFLKAPAFLRVLGPFLVLVTAWIITITLFHTSRLWLNYTGVSLGSLLLIFVNVAYRRRLLARNYRRVKHEISRLEKYNNILEEAAEMRDILTDTIVHDIKNSIAAVEGSLMYVTEKYKNDQYTLQTFHAANVACQDIINLSSNLLDVRKIEEGQMEFSNVDCSHSEILELVRRFGQYPLFFEKNIRLEIREPGEPLTLSADRYLIEQVIHNLLNNALKYTSSGGQIVVSFGRQEAEVVLSFFNSGRPITEKQQQIIFEKYIRLGKGRSKYSKGLGLYFCRMAMEIQQGRIWVTTSEEGNLFHLGFKAAEAGGTRQ